MLDGTSVTQTVSSDNGQTPRIRPAVWGEYTLRQNPTPYSAAWNCSDGAILGTVAWEPGTGFYFDPALVDGAYVPAPNNWADYISGDVDALNAIARGQIASAA